MSLETQTRTVRNAICTFAWIWLSIASMWGQANEVAVQAFPNTPLIEVRDGQQLLNFDFAVKNTGRNTLDRDRNDGLQPFWRIRNAPDRQLRWTEVQASTSSPAFARAR